MSPGGSLTKEPFSLISFICESFYFLEVSSFIIPQVFFHITLIFMKSLHIISFLRKLDFIVHRIASFLKSSPVKNIDLQIE